MLPYSSSSGAAPEPETVSPEPAARKDPRPPAASPHKHLGVVIAAALGVVVLAGAIFAFYYIFLRTPPPNVTLEPQVPDRVLVGEPFKLIVRYVNSSDEELKNASLSVTLPDGISILGTEPSTRLSQQNVGDIAPRAIGSRALDLVVTDGPESVKRLNIAFRYALTAEQRTLFQSDEVADISVGTHALALNFRVPQNVFAGQSFDLGVEYRNDSRTPFRNVRLAFDYPQDFQFAQATSTPSAARESDDRWDLGMLEPGTQGVLMVTGTMNGDERSFFNVGAHLQVDIEGRTYDLGGQTAAIGIVSPPLSVAIVPNGDPDHVAYPGQTLSYELNYRNASAFTLQNLVIQANLEGQFFDISTLSTGATLDSVTNTLTWETANTPDLASLPPGGTGSVRFSIRLRNEWPIQQPDDKDFSVRVQAGIRSLSVPEGISAKETEAMSELVTKLGGQAAVSAEVYFREPDGDVVNEGPYPPKVNEATQYTVHWQVRNYSTDLKDVRLDARLLSGARMVRVIKSDGGTEPVYDSRTGQVAWSIPSVAAGRGILNEPLEAVFQIEVTPALNQEGSNIPLIAPTSFSATDAWTGRTIQLTAPERDSNLPDDPDAAKGDRRVRE